MANKRPNNQQFSYSQSQAAKSHRLDKRSRKASILFVAVALVGVYLIAYALIPGVRNTASRLASQATGRSCYYHYINGSRVELCRNPNQKGLGGYSPRSQYSPYNLTVQDPARANTTLTVDDPIADRSKKGGCGATYETPCPAGSYNCGDVLYMVGCVSPKGLGNNIITGPSSSRPITSSSRQSAASSPSRSASPAPSRRSTTPVCPKTAGVVALAETFYTRTLGRFIGRS